MLGSLSKIDVVKGAIQAIDEYKMTGNLDVLRPFFDPSYQGAAERCGHIINYGKVFSNTFLNRMGKRRLLELDYLHEALMQIDSVRYSKLQLP